MNLISVRKQLPLALAPSNWQEVNDLTVANLYWYFQGNDESAKQTATT